MFCSFLPRVSVNFMSYEFVSGIFSQPLFYIGRWQIRKRTQTAHDAATAAVACRVSSPESSPSASNEPPMSEQLQQIKELNHFPVSKVLK